MTDLDIMRLALEALEVATTPFARDRQEVLRAQAALREALAEQPAQQEPVAVVSGYYGGQCVILPIDPARIFNSNTALYTSPPAQRKPLKLREIEKCIYDANNDPIVACRNVEAAHGIKENT